jgi:hypothetical protein
MTYSMIIQKNLYDPEYINGLQTWQQVTEKLRSGLPTGTKSVHIYKFSSNNKTIGSCIVTMANIVKVANTLRDKQALY